MPKRPNRKPGSVLNDDLSRLHVAMQLQPPPEARRARIASLWALLLVGFTEPRKLPSALVRSYRTFPPFPVRCTGSLFLLHYPWGHPRLPLAVTIPLWSPDFPQGAKAPRRRMFCSSVRFYYIMLYRFLARKILGCARMVCVWAHKGGGGRDARRSCRMRPVLPQASPQWAVWCRQLYARRGCRCVTWCVFSDAGDL